MGKITEVMKKEFIPYEQALTLKELGFDEPCFAFYTPEQQLIIARGDVLQSSIENAPTAPLCQQAFRWFREKYGLDSNTINTNMWNTFSFVINDIPNKNPITTYLDFNTYEEAELECLKKLIEIVKNL